MGTHACAHERDHMHTPTDRLEAALDLVGAIGERAGWTKPKPLALVLLLPLLLTYLVRAMPLVPRSGVISHMTFTGLLLTVCAQLDYCFGVGV